MNTLTAPLVSCIMPTYNRREMIPLALRSFLSQDWPAKELIAVDDGDDPVGDLCERVPGCVYLRTSRFRLLSDKVSFACGQAAGEIIATWDDDDFSMPGRLTDQVTRLMQSGRALTGYSTMLYWDGRYAWRYVGMPHYACGLSHVYRKSVWNAARFEPKDVGYDNDLWQWARDTGQCIVVPGEPPLMIGRIHPRNVSPKKMEGSSWRRADIGDIPLEFFEAIRA